jgi:hypothetical protein
MEQLGSCTSGVSEHEVRSSRRDRHDLSALLGHADAAAERLEYLLSYDYGTATNLALFSRIATEAPSPLRLPPAPREPCSPRPAVLLAFRAPNSAYFP